MERYENVRDEMKVNSDTVDKNKVEGLDKKRLVFIEKNLYKIANLDSKTCKNKTMKGKLGNIQNEQIQVQQSQTIQALQQQQAQILVLLLQRQ